MTTPCEIGARFMPEILDNLAAAVSLEFDGQG